MPPAVEESSGSSPDVDGDLEMTGTDQASSINDRNASKSTPNLVESQAATAAEHSTSPGPAVAETDGFQTQTSHPNQPFQLVLDISPQHQLPSGHSNAVRPSSSRGSSGTPGSGPPSGHQVGRRADGHTQASAPKTASAQHNGHGLSRPPDHVVAFAEQCASLGRSFQDAQPEALRRVIRDHWQKSTLNSEYHMEFLVDVVMKNIPAASMDKMTQRLATIVTPAVGTAVATKLTTAQIDMAAASLIDKASDKFLTSCLYKRLESIGARQLVDALAFQKRLGFDFSDEIREGEQVAPMSIVGKAGVPTDQIEKGSSGDLGGVYQCQDCDLKFVQRKPFIYHTTNRKCQDVPKGRIYSRCGACGTAFTSPGGIGYHATNNVCGGFGADSNTSTTDSTVPLAQHFQTALEHIPSSAPSKVQTPVPVPQLPPMRWQPPMTQTQSPITSKSPHGGDMVRSDLQPTIKSPGLPPAPTSGFTPVPASRLAQQPSSTQIKTPSQKNSTPSNGGPEYTPSGESDELKSALAKLTEEQRRDYYERMAKQEQGYELKIQKARREYSGEAQVVKLKSLKACFAAAQSSVRQRFGIKLRGRRRAAASIAENQRLGFDLTPTQARQAAQEGASTTSSHGAKLSQGAGHPPRQALNSTPGQPHTPQVAVSDMNGGLAGSSATAAMEDPTVNASPSRVRTSFVAYNSSPAHPTQPFPPQHKEPLRPPPPIEVESSDDSDSDIPGA